MGKMKVYHGSYMVKKNPKIIKGKNTKDFGVGFYCTIIREQALRWTRKYDTPVVNTYYVRAFEDLNILEFKEMTDEWLDFIISSRNGKGHDYDVVIGPMADDQIYNFINDYLDGVISRDLFWELAKFKYPTHQICFCTKKGFRIFGL